MLFQTAKILSLTKAMFDCQRSRPNDTVRLLAWPIILSNGLIVGLFWENWISSSGPSEKEPMETKCEVLTKDFAIYISYRNSNPV